MSARGVLREARARLARRRSSRRPSNGAVVLAVLALTLALASPSIAADAPLSAQQQLGQKLFRTTCVYCHSEKVWGTLAIERRRGANDAVLEKRTDLVPAFVKSVVRNGLGSMPAYRRTELTDTEVDAIIAYLTRANLAN